MKHESPGSISLVELIPYPGAEVPGREKLSIIAARSVLEKTRSVLIREAIARDATVQDLFGFDIHVIGSQDAALKHRQYEKCTVYDRVGIASVKRIQAALEARCGRKLEVVGNLAKDGRTKKVDL
jgi:hypothetical protein